MAVQTPLHGVLYSCFEGVSPPYGSTLISDFGAYSVKTSVSQFKQGKDRGPDTPEEVDSDSAEVARVASMPGQEEEAALYKAFKRHAITIELKGIRHLVRFSIKLHDKKSTGT